LGDTTHNIDRFGRLAILAEGKFGVLTSKTAACVIRYVPEKVAAVIDSTRAGAVAQDVLGFGGPIPVVASMEAAMAYSPESLLIGIAPRGGALPVEWRRVLLEAIEGGLNILNGLHHVLRDDPEISAAAARAGVEIWDIRVPRVPEAVATGALRRKHAGRVVLTVGSDCRTGKMTVAFELARYLIAAGQRAEFVPTGQTGILLAGWGEAVDRVPGDFMAAVTEDLTISALGRADTVIVEGQGSIIHPAYSAVALGIMHGCCPDAMILCHQPSRTSIPDYDVAFPPMPELIRLHEEAAAWVKPSRVVAIAVNTFDMEETEARKAAARLEDETGLPVVDALRWGCSGLASALEETP
jgi:uncharacterized NAD-dependent epimerase/dehydratase family protein